MNYLPSAAHTKGPSFAVAGWRVSWQGWDLRLSFNGREGLVLHDVAYADPQEGGRRRPVLHRAAIAEMAVPYAGARLRDCCAAVVVCVVCALFVRGCALFVRLAARLCAA